MKSQIALILVAVAVTLTGGAPVDDDSGIDEYLSSLNGTTCMWRAVKSGPVGITTYDYCFDVCYDRNGVKVCYKQCGYSSTAPEVEPKQVIHKDLNEYINSVNGSVCLAAKSSDTKPGVQTYGLCWFVCVNRNGIRVCYTRCS